MSLTNDALGPERTYRSATVGLWFVAGLVLAGGLIVGRPIAGAVGFWVVAVGSIGLSKQYDGTLFDERDRRVYRSAAGTTLALFGWGSAVLFTTMTVLAALDLATWPRWLVPISWAVALVYGTLLVVWIVAKRR